MRYFIFIKWRTVNFASCLLYQEVARIASATSEQEQTIQLKPSSYKQKWSKNKKVKSKTTQIKDDEK